MNADWWVAILALTFSCAGYGLAATVSPESAGTWSGIGILAGAGVGLGLGQLLKRGSRRPTHWD